MRLGQFARKLEVKPSEIADFLNSEHDQSISVHPNSKIPDELLQIVEERFAIAKVETEENIIETAENTEVSSVADVVTEEKTEDVDEVIEAKGSDSVENSDETEQSDSETTELKEWQRGEFVPDELKEQAETIKAPKIDLEGLKVVGKIELPEKPVKTEEELKAEKEQRTKSKSKPSKKKKKFTKEEREAYAEKKRQAAIEKRQLEQKEQKRKEHYEKILESQKSIAKKGKKKKKKATSENRSNKKQVNKPEPTTFWGKFKRWLNDE